MLVLKNSKVVQGAQLGRQLLEWAEAEDPQTIGLLIELDQHHEFLLNQQLEQRREQRRG